MIYNKIEDITDQVVSAFYDFYITWKLIHDIDHGYTDIDDEDFDKLDKFTDILLKFYNFNDKEFINDLNMSLIRQYIIFKSGKTDLFDHEPWKKILFEKTLDLDKEIDLDLKNDDNIKKWINDRYNTYIKINQIDK